MAYTITYRPAAQRDIRVMERRTVERIIRKIETLADEPRPQGVKKLVGGDGYRIRAGSFRILFLIDDAAQAVTIVQVVDRKDAY